MNNQGSLSGNQVIESQNDYNQILQGWKNDPEITQLNWDLMYNATTIICIHKIILKMEL